MRRSLACLALILAAPLASATIRYAEINTSAGPATALAENGCPAWVLETNDDDCSYNGGKPLGLGNSQWVGPVFSAGYYAPGTAPQIFVNADLGLGPVNAPAPELPLGGKIGIPIARGFISIDDIETPSGIDDIIGGTLEFGPFQRNVAVSAGTRVIESIDRVIHRISRVRVSDATPNGSGGFDYVVAKADKTPAFPAPLSGLTTFDGGFSDQFPSQVASQSSPDPLDTPYWTSPGPYGLAVLDEATAVLGTRSTATVWGYSCDDGVPVPVGCLTNGANWDGDNRAAFSNILLRISTDSGGNVISADAFLVQDSDLSQTADGDDSWTATRLSFAGQATDLPAAFDDRRVLEVDPTTPPQLLPSLLANVLANDLGGAEPVTVSIVTQPAEGTATLSVPPSDPNQIEYTAGSTAESEQTIVYQVTDANSATATGELHIVVTHPVACEDDSTAGQRDSAVNVTVTANDSGFDNPPPTTVTVTAAPEEGTTVVNPDRTITFTPPADTGGIFNIAYSLSDGANNPVTCNVEIRIPAQPEAVDDTVGVSVNTEKVIDVLANDLEVTDTPLTLTIVTQPTHGTAELVPGTTGTDPIPPKIRYTPSAGYTGPDVLTYTVTDADTDISGVATVTITVFGPPQNDLPACADDTIDAERGDPTTIDVLANDTGLNAEPITVEIVETSFADESSTVVNPDNTITATPPSDEGGTFFIAYRASEGLGEPVQCTVTVTVDDLPIANDDELFGVNFGKLFLIRPLNNDTGLQDRPITLEITQQPTHGTLQVCDAPSAACPGYTTGSLPFVSYVYDDDDPSTGYPAVDIFKYQLRDDDGDTSEVATATVTPRNTVAAEDDPDGFQTPETSFRAASGYPVTLNVLANDGGLLRTPLVVSLESMQPGATAVVNADNTVTFSPYDDFTGFSGFTYRITDADGKSDTATVRVFVFPAPVTDSGSSAFDWYLAATMAAGLACRRLRRRAGHSPAV